MIFRENSICGIFFCFGFHSEKKVGFILSYEEQKDMEIEYQNPSQSSMSKAQKRKFYEKHHESTETPGGPRPTKKQKKLGG